jgi:hypothetical protein
MPRNTLPIARIGTICRPSAYSSNLEAISSFHTSKKSEITRNIKQQAITKNFITRAYTLGASSFLLWLKKKGSAASLNICIKIVINTASL